MHWQARGCEYTACYYLGYHRAPRVFNVMMIAGSVTINGWSSDGGDRGRRSSPSMTTMTIDVDMRFL